MNKSESGTDTVIFNSSVELGARAALLLTCLSEHKLDLDQLVFFDYVLLYSSEFSGPGDIHPPVPNHLAEIVHRREYLPGALRLFLSRGLISAQAIDSGVYYSANDDTAQFVRCLRSDYYKNMWKNLFWIEDNFNKLCAERGVFLSRLGSRNDNKKN